MYNNKNKILIGCLALLLVMSVGYALFSDNIEINTTAKTEGDFSFEVTAIKGIDSDIKTSDMYAVLNNVGTTGAETDFGIENGIEASTISSSGNTVNISVPFTKFDGSEQQYFTVKITNGGSIPIALDYKKIKNNIMKELVGSISGEANIRFPLLSSNHNPDDHEFEENFGLNIFNIYVPKKNYDEMKSKGTNALAKLETGESVYAVFVANLSALEEWKMYEYKKLKKIDLTSSVVINLPITQYLD